jgi:hypothetical protein
LSAASSSWAFWCCEHWSVRAALAARTHSAGCARHGVSRGMRERSTGLSGLPGADVSVIFILQTADFHLGQPAVVLPTGIRLTSAGAIFGAGADHSADRLSARFPADLRNAATCSARARTIRARCGDALSRPHARAGGPGATDLHRTKMRLVEVVQSLGDAVMSDEIRKRISQASQSLVPRDPAPTGRVDLTKGADLIAKTRAALEPPSPPVAPANMPAPPNRVEQVRLAGTCGATGRSFIAIAERRNAELWLIGSELPRNGRGGGDPPALLSGSYRIEMTESWHCPICRSRASQEIWVCECNRFRGALHCGGTSGRASYCACGRFEERGFIETDWFQLRGTSMAAQRGAPRAGTQHGRSHKQVTHERNK